MIQKIALICIVAGNLYAGDTPAPCRVGATAFLSNDELQIIKFDALKNGNQRSLDSGIQESLESHKLVGPTSDNDLVLGAEHNFGKSYKRNQVLLDAQKKRKTCTAKIGD